MPELPEITLLARQMNADLVGKTIAGVEVLQPRCLNVPVDKFAEALVARPLAVTPAASGYFVGPIAAGCCSTWAWAARFC